MSTGQLYDLRSRWRRFSANIQCNPPEEFVKRYGNIAQYLHIGIDSEQVGKTRIYHSQPYAVFAAVGYGRVAFTPTELEALRRHAENHGSSVFRCNMAGQLDQADRDMKVNIPLIGQLSGAARRLALAR